jgi:hypothetical protein
MESRPEEASRSDAEPQIPPLRYASVGMTILFGSVYFLSPNIFRSQAFFGPTQNCHPDRSAQRVVEGSAVLPESVAKAAEET